MTDTLRRAVAHVEQLPPEQQDAIAEIIERELEEREWANLVATPKSQRFLRELAAQARREDAAGETLDLTDHS